MSAVFSQNFELTVLLRYKDLDIRGLAAKNPAFSVGNYFFSLSKFINQAPFITEALARVAAQNSDKADYQMISDFKLLLEEIGCKKYVQYFNDMAEGCRRGNKAFASSCAKQISDNFNNLVKKITEAKKLPKTETGHQISEKEDMEAAEIDLSTSNQSLKLILDQLDRNETARKLKILVVDDAPVILKTIFSILGDEYKVYGMTNPLMLEKFLQQITPELFLLDYKMPELNGFELIPIIRHFKEHKDTPIIFLTSMGTIDHVSAAIMLGACDFLVKPVQPDLIREKVSKHIVRKKLF